MSTDPRHLTNQLWEDLALAEPLKPPGIRAFAPDVTESSVLGS
jgi:hypothetical protein